MRRKGVNYSKYGYLFSLPFVLRVSGFFAISGAVHGGHRVYRHEGRHPEADSNPG